MSTAYRLSLPLRTYSEPNRRDHWAARAKRMRSHRRSAHLATATLSARSLPCVVMLTRVAPRRLDDDNLRAALKGVRDGIADRLGIADNDPRADWQYGQRSGKPGEYAVTIVVTPRLAAMGEAP